MKKLFFFAFFLILLSLPLLNPPETKAQYGDIINPVCKNTGYPYLQSCTLGGFKCTQTENAWCSLTWDFEAPQCPSDHPIPQSDGKCAACASGYAPNTDNTACIRVTRCERNGYEQYCRLNHGAGSECVPSDPNGDGCTQPSANASQACTDRNGMCSVACNSTDYHGPLGEYGCSSSQYCCVPQKTSCSEENFFIEYKCENSQVCFLDVIKNQQTSCLWKETDALGKAGYHCQSTYKCDSSCLSNISCFTTREKCIRDAFSTRDICYNDPRKTQKEKETCSENYIEKIDSCMDAYNAANCSDKVKSCYGAKAAPTQAPAPKPAGGTGSSPSNPSNPSNPTPTKAPISSNGGGSSSGSPTNTCPASGDTCVYSDESGVCYSGHGATGFNVAGCKYSCGPVSCPKLEKKSGREYINCTPGEPVGEDEKACPKGKKGTCGGHYYCVWSEEGTYKSDFKCETEKETCFDKESSSGDGGSCKDNPTSPPEGYTWKNSCKACSNNDDCPKNNGDPAVNPGTSNWCFGGSCLMLVTGSSGNSNQLRTHSQDDDDDEDDDDKDDDDDEDDGKTRDDTGNRNKNHSKNDKCPRDWAQKPIDKLNKDRLNQGLPTLTPLPPDCNYTPGKAEPTPTPSPTPLPPLPEPANLKATCGPTTDPKRPYGIRFSWDAVQGSIGYAIRIDDKSTPWTGDTPSAKDTVDNTVKGLAFAREATPGATFEWWVHSINKSGVYSILKEKKTFACPVPTPTKAGQSGSNTVGAGELIVLP